MNIDYSDSNGCLCFRHAAKAVMENDEHISTNIDESDPGESGYFSFCYKCSKEYESEEYKGGV